MAAVLTRRSVLAGLALMLAAPEAHAGKAGWIEVIGTALAQGDADRDAARRRAVADAILAAALADGAEVRGHSVLKNTRLTSDMLVVRPVGRVLAHEVVAEHFDGRMWQVRLRARVGAAQPGDCPDRRKLALTAWAPTVRVSAHAPAWAGMLGDDLAALLVERAGRHPAVADLVRATNRSGRKPAGDGFDYVALTRGASKVPGGGHELALALDILTRDRDLVMELRMVLTSPSGETVADTHRASVRLPGPSVLGRASMLVEDDRQRMAQRLSAGAAPALEALLDKAGCQGALAVMAVAGGRIEVPVGRDHGLSRTSLAFTVDRDNSTELLEVADLSARRAVLRPLDPDRGARAFAGRAVRFVDSAVALP